MISHNYNSLTFGVDCVIVGYTDTYCETDINECLSNPCQGQGICTDLLDAFNCSCNAGLVLCVVFLSQFALNDLCVVSIRIH